MATLEEYIIYDGCITTYLDDTILCDEEESYKSDAQFTGTQTVQFPNGYITSGNLYTRYAPDNFHDGRACIYFDENSVISGKAPSIAGMGCYFAYDVYGYLVDNSSYLCMTDGNLSPSLVDNNVATFSTNIPFFDNYTDAEYYYRTGMGIQQAKNLSVNPEEDVNEEIYLYSLGIIQTWDAKGLVYENDSSSVSIHKGIRGKLKKGKLSLYSITGIDDGALKYGIKLSDDIEWVYLEKIDGYTDEWETAQSVDIGFLYRKRVDEIGTFHASKIALDTNKEFNAKIPIFEDEEQADGYIDGTVPIIDAINWGTISGDYPITNLTEDGDEESTFGNVYTRAFFSQLYMLGEGACQEISNALFDTDSTGVTHLWDNIKEGLGMYGQDPMQVVQGLMYFPINLSTVFSNYSSQQYIYFGGYKLDLTNGVKKLIYPNGYKSIGSFVIKKSFNNWRDYEPYTKCYVYLPYVGTYQIDLSRYYNKTTEVRYYIDIRTGCCTACLLADGLLIDYFNGQMGTQMPITLTDKSAYANTQVRTLVGGAKSEIGGIGDSISIGAQSSPIAAAATFAVDTAINLTGTTYALSQNNINRYNKTKGGSSSMINQYLPQYVTFIFEILEDMESPYLNNLAGKPSNASGRLGDFSGYLECDDVLLICPTATDNERQEIINLVKTGIYI